ncbi:MAG: PHP domain-containing protein [Bifidobacteriaceae bacterium]|jgi:predicted metal-dependent phosphoesterase TrpH|nr:PHP domain-containing protein [Bifidobacteriaceae bacterium]
MRIDLHTHSTVSDGTDSPAEVMEAARAAGLDAVALTDHDTTAGWQDAAQAAARAGIGLVRGTEFSTRCQGRSVHLLSYLHDPLDPGLLAETSKVRDSRAVRARIMVERLGQDFPITWDDVEAQAGPEATIGRPHIADALVAAGIVGDRTAAFADLLSPRGPYYERHYAPLTVDLIQLVRQAGGFAVFAHPGAASRGRIVDDAAIEEMADAGLGGLEVRHRDNSPEQQERLKGLASRLGLVVTGSSDYHGTGKPNRLGENLTDVETLDAIVACATATPLL